jgi:hypothetical protein
MKRIAALFTALPLACGLLLAQTDTQQSSSQSTTTTTTTQTETRPATTTSSTTRTTTDTHTLPTITQWKGILVDASCAAGAKSTTSSTTSSTDQTISSTTSTTDQSGSANRTSVTNQGGTTPDQGGITTGTQNPPATTTSSDQNTSGQTKTVDTGRHHKGRRNRDAAQTQSCPVSSSTTMFALKTQDGQVLRFDAVGNARAAAELKNKPKWSKDLAEGKPIRATVDGMMSGDTVTVTDVH